jgi:hypothetical protein
VLQAFFKIPVPTLSALIPVLEGVDQKVVTAQLKALGGLSAEDIKKMVFFLNNVSRCEKHCQIATGYRCL